MNNGSQIKLGGPPLHQQEAPSRAGDRGGDRGDGVGGATKELPLATTTLASTEGRVDVVRKHYVRLGYRVRSGLSFGCHLVLYADDPDRVHSDFCVHVVGPDNRIDWRTMQTLARSMPDLHKSLILANVRPASTPKGAGGGNANGDDGNGDGDGEGELEFEVEELAIATEHAPFRHREARKGVGEQRKGAVGGGGA